MTRHVFNNHNIYITITPKLDRMNVSSFFSLTMDPTQKYRNDIRLAKIRTIEQIVINTAQTISQVIASISSIS